MAHLNRRLLTEDIKYLDEAAEVKPPNVVRRSDTVLQTCVRLCVGGKRRHGVKTKTQLKEKFN